MYIRQIGRRRRGSRWVLLLHDLQRRHPWMVTVTSAISSVIEWLDNRSFIFWDTFIFTWIRTGLRPSIAIRRSGFWSWHFLMPFTMDTTVLSWRRVVLLKSFGGQAQISMMPKSALCWGTSSSHVFSCRKKNKTIETVMMDAFSFLAHPAQWEKLAIFRSWKKYLPWLGFEPTTLLELLF